MRRRPDVEARVNKAAQLREIGFRVRGSRLHRGMTQQRLRGGQWHLVINDQLPRVGMPQPVWRCLPQTCGTVGVRVREPFRRRHEDRLDLVVQTGTPQRAAPEPVDQRRVLKERWLRWQAAQFTVGPQHSHAGRWQGNRARLSIMEIFA